MSYYDDVYIPRLNRFGTTRQERILGKRSYNFEHFLENRSIYRVEFISNYVNYIGVLEPGKGTEKDILSYLLLPLTSSLETGAVLEIGEKFWLVLFYEEHTEKGYNKYKVCLLDRLVTWWDSSDVMHTSPANFNGKMTSIIKDSTNQTQGAPVFRELENYSNLIMPFSADLQQDNYLKIDGSDRRFIVTGFDIETIPGVQYVTIDLTMRRNADKELETPAIPTSFWGGSS